MNAVRDTVLARITAAFWNRLRIPDGLTLFSSRSPEVDHESLEKCAMAGSWRDVPDQLIRDNAIAIAFASREGFAWLLPAWLLAAARESIPGAAVTTALLSCLTPPDPEDARRSAALAETMEQLEPGVGADLPVDAFAHDSAVEARFLERAGELSESELLAVRVYLEWLATEADGHYPLLGPDVALQRYWALDRTEDRDG
ncbi:MAG: hypothetical protein AAGE01_11500 [Pseudomonadota bacterium]